MRRFLFTLLLLFALQTMFGCAQSEGGPPSHVDGGSPPDAPRDPGGIDAAVSVMPRVLVVPFENRAASRAHGAYSFGLAAVLAERLEGDSRLIAINGPLVLTPEQVRLVSTDATGLDLAAANSLAVSRGATHFVTGEFRGQVWSWTFEARLYAVRPDGPVLAGQGSASGDLTVPLTRASGRIDRVQSAQRIHALFAEAVGQAFDAAGIALAPETMAAVADPSTEDAYAFLLLSRAYARYFGRTVPVSDEAIVDVAEHAVLVDPAQPEAQRLYAQVLVEIGRPRAARSHYETAIAARPRDFRSLIELGKIELAEHNPDVARGYLARAVEARPHDAETHYWLARAHLDLESAAEATSSFERARTLDPSHLESRRALVRLYADARRYRDAAEELRAVTAQAPDDIESAFLLAACLRADGRRDEAIEAYAAAAVRFPADPRFHRFRGDLLAEAGRTEESAAAYGEAVRVSSSDARSAAIVAGSPSADLLGGRAFLSAIADGVRWNGLLEEAHANFSLAINDAILDLTQNGAEACRDGRGASSALLAREEGRRYHGIGRDVTGTASRIDAALRRGEGAALTPDERRAAEAVLAASDRASRDLREMRTLFDGTFVPLYRRHECETFDGPIAPATIAAVRSRYADRRVTLPEVRPPTYAMPISPVVPPDPAAVVTFRVNNAEGRRSYVLVLDGKELGVIPAGATTTFSARLGPHDVCLVPEGTECGAPGTVRRVYIHQRWTIRVRPGSD